MRKGFATALGIVAVIVLLVVVLATWLIGIRNRMVTLDEQVKTAWGQVENQYQRRADLIPNLVQTVKGYASHESEVLTQVAEARSRAGGVLQIGEGALDDPAQFQKFQAAQNELTAALSRLMVVSERYPDLKANENFLALQSQLEGTENRISVERRRFNETVMSYNTFVRKFPNSMLAGSFPQRPYFQSTPGADKAPVVDFGGGKPPK